MARKKRKTHFSVRAGQRIAGLIKKIAHGKGAEADKDRLSKTIERYLESGQDQVFDKAFDRLDDPDATDKLDLLIGELAEIRLVSLQSRDGESETGEAMLFAVPLALSRKEGQAIPSHLRDVEPIARSFRKHGVIGNGPSVWLLDGLFRLEDVDLPPSRRFSMLRSLIENGALRLSPSPDSPLSDAPGLALRFLIGMVVSPMDGEIPFCPDEAAETAYEDACKRWVEATAGEIASQSGADQVILLAPDQFTEAIKTGVDLYRETSLAIIARAAVIKAAEQRQGCRAVISFHGAQVPETVQVGFFDEGDAIIDGFVGYLAPHDDPDRLGDVFVDRLTEAGVDQVLLAGGLQPFEQCQCCGKPLFLAPSGAQNAKHETLH